MISFQECDRCGCQCDPVYMACPDCGNILAYEYDDYDVCREEGHQWRSTFNEECSECAICGTVDC